MTRGKTPSYVHKLYAGGLIFVVLFVLIAWGYTAYSLSAPILPEDPDHQPSIAAAQCLECHQTKPDAPRLPHIEFPSCGYCHRLPLRLPGIATPPSR